MEPAQPPQPAQSTRTWAIKSAPGRRETSRPLTYSIGVTSKHPIRAELIALSLCIKQSHTMLMDS